MHNILFDIRGNSSWIGGVYYMKNMVFQLLCLRELGYNVQPIVLCTEEFRNVFSEFENKMKLVVYNEKSKMSRLVALLKVLTKTEYIYNYHEYQFDILKKLRKKAIYWVPDFQHNHLPQYFTKDELERRTREYLNYANSKSPIVFSSNDSLNDFRRFYSKDKKNVYVVPFVSYIEKMLRELSREKEQKILNKFFIANKRYACIMNQFWQHKNHLVVFQAIKKYFEQNPDSEFVFVFTGNMEDYRSPEYIEKLKNMVNEPCLANHIKLLGFIDREEQIAIMKNAEYVIQPSLFEGWGTVVEDAKVLDKTILLSDISVHREQKNNKCILFDPYDSGKLMELIASEIGKEHVDNCEVGVQDMYRRAQEYSKGFERLLEEIE